MTDFCVVIPTDDFLHVKVGHFGDAKYYVHYIRKDDKWFVKRLIVNPYAGIHAREEEDEEEGKRLQIYEMNKECNYMVAVVFGPGGEEFMKRHGFKVVKVKPRTTILEALNTALKVFKEDAG